MTEQALNKLEDELYEQFRKQEITEEDIIGQIRSNVDAVTEILKSGSDLFLRAIWWNRFETAKLLAGMGADVHCRMEGSIIGGNALNVAHTREQAEYLLGLDIEIERNLKLSGTYRNPAIAAAMHNDRTMVSYWLDRQREIFAEDEEFVRELVRATIETISMMNQYDMLAHIMQDEHLFDALKEQYAMEDSKELIKLELSALRQIKDAALAPRVKELCRILNARKRELSGT